MGVLVGKKAPSFHAKAVINGGDIADDFSLDQYLGKKYVIFFFYPADFSFVCPTEILAFHNRIDEFEKRNVAVVGCSADSEFSHWKWLQTDKKEGGIRGVKYPLVSDESKTIAQNYDVLAGTYGHDEEGRATFTGLPRSYRGLFLIDRQGIVRHQIVNDIPLGRSIDEAIRMVDALQFFEEIGEVCPADWHKGDKGIKETQESIYAYLADIE